VLCPHYGYIERGTENATKDTNIYLQRRGHDTIVFGLGHGSNKIIHGLRKDFGIGRISDRFFEKTMLGGFSRKYLGFNPNIEDIVFSWKVEDYLKHVANNYDLLWSSGEYWCAKTVTDIGKKSKVPSLLFFGGGESKMMVKEAKLNPDIFIVMTPIMEQWLKEKVPDCNVNTVVGGVDLDFFRPTIEPYCLDCERPIVLTTSAFLKSKRLDLVIRAMDKLGKGTLIMTSDGPERNKICRLGKNLLGKRFKYMGVQPFENIPKLCCASDVLVMTSKKEPYGRTLLESMACNTPVIAPYDKTREWMIGEGGMLVDNMRSLPEIIDTTTKIEWSDKPRKQAEKFSWENSVDMYEKAFKGIGLI